MILETSILNNITAVTVSLETCNANKLKNLVLYIFCCKIFVEKSNLHCNSF